MSGAQVSGATLAEVNPDVGDFVTRGSKLYARAVCQQCCKTGEMAVPFRCGRVQFGRIYCDVGWDIGADGSLICPDCVYRARQARHGQRAPVVPSYPKPTSEAISMGKSVETAGIDLTATADLNRVEGGKVREPSLKEMRQICAALEEHFIDGQYANGKTDSLIGAELDLPSEMVRVVRVNAFGVLANPELDQIRRDLDQAKGLVQRCYQRLAQIEQKAAS